MWAPIHPLLLRVQTQVQIQQEIVNSVRGPEPCENPVTDPSAMLDDHALLSRTSSTNSTEWLP